MNSIVFFANSDEWKPEAWVTLMKGSMVEEKRYVVETSDSWVSIYEYDNVFDDYDSQEKQQVISLVRSPTPYLIEWRGDKLLEKFIEDFPLNIIGVIDNDHGLICEISDLKGMQISKWVHEKALVN